MTQAKYNVVLSLTKEEYDRLQSLRANGIKIIEVFRAGLYGAKLEELKENQNKIKEA